MTHGVGMAKLEVGIVVRDADAMAGFYRDVLGLEYVGDLEIPGGAMRRFACGDAVVKLVSIGDPPKASNPPLGPAGGVSGLRYLSVQVDDVEAGVARCVAAGHPVPVPMFDFQPGVPVAIVEDPEGNWIELVQPPAG